MINLIKVKHEHIIACAPMSHMDGSAALGQAWLILSRLAYAL